MLGHVVSNSLFRHAGTVDVEQRRPVRPHHINPIKQTPTDFATQRLCYLLLKKHRNRKQCQALLPRFLRAVYQWRQAGLAPLVSLGQTLHSWSAEIVAMWRFTRNNRITEGFHNKWNSSTAKLMASVTSKTIGFASRSYGG